MMTPARQSTSQAERLERRPLRVLGMVLLSILALLLLASFAWDSLVGGTRHSLIVVKEDTSRKPWTLEVSISTSSGDPVRGAVVWADNTSGGSEGVTDSTGRVVLGVGEGTVDAVYVNGILIKRWRIGALNVSKGRRIAITLATNIPPEQRMR